MFRNTGANTFAKNQTRLAYEDKRDLYCIPARNVIYDIRNTQGKEFVEFLQEMNMCVLNGRCVDVV